MSARAAAGNTAAAFAFMSENGFSDRKITPQTVFGYCQKGEKYKIWEKEVDLQDFLQYNSITFTGKNNGKGKIL